MYNNRPIGIWLCLRMGLGTGLRISTSNKEKYFICSRIFQLMTSMLLLKGRNWVSLGESVFLRRGQLPEILFETNQLLPPISKSIKKCQFYFFRLFPNTDISLLSWWNPSLGRQPLLSVVVHIWAVDGVVRCVPDRATVSPFVSSLSVFVLIRCLNKTSYSF